MHAVSTFFTPYSALHEGRRVEAIGVVVSGGDSDEPTFRLLVVDDGGLTSLVDADKIDMYGAYERDESPVRPPFEVIGIDHVQLGMPPGREDEARRFYGAILGMREVPKPAALAARAGCWFAGPDVAVHLSVDSDHRPSSRWHPALAVADLEGARMALAASSVAIEEDDSGLRVRRFYVRDPFGNRLELVDARDAGFSEH